MRTKNDIVEEARQVMIGSTPDDKLKTLLQDKNRFRFSGIEDGLSHALSIRRKEILEMIEKIDLDVYFDDELNRIGARMMLNELKEQIEEGEEK